MVKQGRYQSGQTFYVASNGCIRRMLEAQRVVDYMVENGYVQVSAIDEADYLFHFSCAACGPDEKKSRRMIENMAALSQPHARLILGGCFPQMYPNVCESSGKYLGAIPPRAVDKIDDFFPASNTPFCTIREPTKVTSLEYENPFRNSDTWAVDRHKYELTHGVYPRSEDDPAARLARFKEQSDIIVIARGCLSQCGYCCVRFSTGRLRSRPLTNIIERCRSLYERGQRRFFLTAEDTAAYGRDIGTGLFSLLEALHSIGPEMEVAINSMNPKWLVGEIALVESFFARNSMVKHAHIPVQSGSDGLLSSMNRGYTVKQLIRLFDAITSSRNRCQVHTHLIIGYPGESEEDVQQTIAFMRRYRKVSYTIFPYSERPGTTASKSSHEVPSKLLWKRMKRVSQALERTADCR
jgi:MiaB/RimO family radical SAM methylthiotransferase